ncbi:hypothetical protein JXA85_07110 [Candidatus Woesearchaeota archaeon]|nr:hypothetical protein [Candidatus Woesearchaeota archaeon]
MDKTTEFLLQWTKTYVENQDLIRKSITGISQKEARLEVNYKAKLHTFLIDPFMENITDEINEISKNKEMKFSIICFNTADNMKRMVMQWTELAKYPLLSIYFVNPFSSLDKRWIIYPWTHNRIADPDSLETGLKSIAENVEQIRKEEVVGKV